MDAFLRVCQSPVTSTLAPFSIESSSYGFCECGQLQATESSSCLLFCAGNPAEMQTRRDNVVQIILARLDQCVRPAMLHALSDMKTRELA